jgi:transcriptional regulator with XRE-family HTH domain
MYIGKNLRKLRDSRNLSQQEVADYIGVERKTYMNWETEVSKVKDTYIPMLADFFKVDINDLFKDNSSKIVITQNNTDNKDNSINNSIIVLLNDKEAVDEIVKIIKRRQGESQKG